MSNESDVKAKPAEAAAPATTEALGQLMADGKVPQKKADGHPHSGVVPSAGGAQPHAGVAAHQGPSRARLAVLRVLLAVNVLAMIALLALPVAKGTGSEPQDAAPKHEGTPAHEPANATKPESGHQRTGRPAYPDKELYTRALQLGFEGKPLEAVAALELYLERNPALPKDQRRNVFLQMQYYNTAAGRTKEAEACLASAQQLLDRSFLPEDLLTAADLAAKNGNGAEMRRNYARFLLLQKSLPGALRDRVAEAYLRLGDSYRIEAENGETAAQAEAEAMQRKLRESKKGVEKPGATREHEGSKPGKEPR